MPVMHNGGIAKVRAFTIESIFLSSPVHKMEMANSISEICSPNCLYAMEAPGPGVIYLYDDNSILLVVYSEYNQVQLDWIFSSLKPVLVRAYETKKLDKLWDTE